MPSKRYLTVDWFGLVGLALGAAYFGRALAHPTVWRFMDAVNLVFHEAGHTIFGIFGQVTFTSLGGSLFQVLLPLALAAYAWRRGQRFAAAVLLMWAGQSLGNVSVYAADAVKMQLPLISDYAEHDWNYLLWRGGLLPHTAAVARAILAAGWASFLVGLALGVRSAIGLEEKEETGGEPEPL
jgi:hypothetical protein